MVRRTSKKNKKEEVNHGRIAGLRNRFIESLRRDQAQWMRETIERQDDLHEHFHSIDFAPCNQPAFEGPDGTLTFQIPNITGYCSICLTNLTKDYPEDYPEEYKFCCSCQAWAKVILLDNNGVMARVYSEAMNKSPTIKKIYERVTLYDGKTRKK